MGIAGLIPFLEKASSSVNIKQLEGSSVAVDSYCWLHKGVFACADKLIRGESTDVHIQYCLKYVDMLLKCKINVIMVFDGRHLPAKAETERKRRKKRDENKKLAKEYLRRNEVEKARSCMQRAIDVSHEMALELIKACRNRGVDCIVAPYEADAQMAWLNKKDLAEYIITEDSDLTLFGARKILFKLDLKGQALLVENTKFFSSMGCKPEKYTFDKFRRMCILSGCDYLDSLHGIGLKKACRFFLTTEEDDMRKALKKIPSYLQMKQLDVTEEYIESFLKAEATFKHMFIYNPLERRMERLNELNEFQTDEPHCCNAGSILENAEHALQLALGNLNPFTLKQLDTWHPNQNWSQKKLKHKSIWRNLIDHAALEKPNEKKFSQKVSGSTFDFKKIEFKNMAEIEMAEKFSEEKRKLEESEIFSIYKYASPKLKQKRKRRQSSSSCCEEEDENNVDFGGTPKKHSHNPFAKVSTTESIKKSPICPSFIKYLSPNKNNVERNSQILISKNTSVKSRFFAANKKQVLQKPFAARDLTTEMFQIEEKTNSYTEQQQNLYYCSLKSPNKNVEKKEQRIDDHSRDNRNQSNEIEIVEYVKVGSNSDTEIKNVFQETDNTSILTEEIVLLSDSEEDQCSQQTKAIIIPKNKLRITCRKPSNTLKSTDTKQSKLSMFGFQKRPALKKL